MLQEVENEVKPVILNEFLIKEAEKLNIDVEDVIKKRLKFLSHIFP